MIVPKTLQRLISKRIKIENLKSDLDKLFEKMAYIGIPMRLSNTIRWLYRQTFFKVGNEEIPINRGVI